MLELNNIYCMDNVEGMKQLEDESIDLTVTSPPYDDLRTYNGYFFDFENVAKQLYRVTKQGGVVVWIVGDATIKGCETLTSFKQALFFRECGFNVETMIWNKGMFTSPQKNKYPNSFEYMFIFSKGKIVCNQIKDRPNKKAGSKSVHTIRKKDGTMKNMYADGRKTEIGIYGVRFNVWDVHPEQSNKKRLHPAPFPEQLAYDHIVSWSNVGDLVLDPFMGSGTTAKVAKQLDRNFIGFEISQEYVDTANRRLYESV